MTQREFLYLYVEAVRNVFGSLNLLNYYALEELLGCKEYSTYITLSHEDDKPLDPDLRRKLEMLAGPHWRAVLIANGIPIPNRDHDK